MQLGMIGLGRMGGNMVLRLLRGGHELVAFDRDSARTAEFDKSESKRSAKGSSLADVVKQLRAPRAVWVMLPAGAITEAAIHELAAVLQPGDTIIDGGNTMFKDDVRRAEELRPKRINYVDVGTSGGVYGLDRGYCLMIGGPKEEVQRLDPLFATLAPAGTEKSTSERGYVYCGPAGAGHFVKMVHNGIEYGLMQAYAEGFEILKRANSTKLPENQRFNLDLHGIAEVWRHGSVVSSWLLDLIELELRADPSLAQYKGRVQDSGEGRWTIEAAIASDVPATVLAAALFTRFRSRKGASFAERILSAMRHQFGGHSEAELEPE